MPGCFDHAFSVSSSALPDDGDRAAARAALDLMVGPGGILRHRDAVDVSCRLDGAPPPRLAQLRHIALEGGCQIFGVHDAQYRGTKLSYTTATSPICRFRPDGAKIPGDAGGRESAWDASPARETEGPAAGRRRGSPIGRKGNREYALRFAHCENTHATYYITAGRGAFLVAGKSPLRAMRHGGFCGRGMEIGPNDPRNPARRGGIPHRRPP